jgi:uracil-DNA glycosylase family 4
MSQPENPQPDIQGLVASVKAHLSSARRSGLRVLSPLQPMRPCAATAEPRALETLEAVRGDLGACSRCSLCHHRTSIVFGQGNPCARLVFVGLAPTPEDDASGAPFCGDEGVMLNNIITRVINLARSDVYLTTIVKCAPPNGRIPAPEEILSCMPFLRRQFASIMPDIVCALGQSAAQALLGSARPLDELRGRFHRVGDKLVMPTYDTAFLRVHEDKKRETWKDMQMIMRELIKKGQAQ